MNPPRLRAGSRVLILRHAETSQPDIFHGAESDVGISERGRRQAETVAPLLAAERPAAVVSSAMRRARESAEPIARACGLELEIQPTLHERRVGPLSGTRTHPPNDLWESTIARWKAGEFNYALPGAESFLDIRNRVLPVWEQLTHRYSGQTWVLVVHGVVIRVLMISILPEFQPFGWHQIGITNLAVNELLWNSTRWVSTRLNCSLVEVA